MPKFPRYESKGTLTTQQPSVLTTPSTDAQITEALGETAGQVQDTTTKFAKARASSMNTVALANHKGDILDIESRAALDPDPNNQSKYLDEIKKSNQKYSENLGAEGKLNLGLESRLAGIKIGAAFKKKEIEIDNVATQRLIDYEVNNPQPDSFAKVQTLLEEKKKLGFISEEQAYKIEEKAKKDFKFNTFTRDLQLYPDLADNRLKRNEYGFDISELEKARTIQEKFEVRAKEEDQELKFNSAVDAGKLLVSGKLNRKTLSNLQESGSMTPEVAGAFELALFSPNWKDFEGETDGKQGMSAQFLMTLIERMDKFSPVTGEEVMKLALAGYNSKPQKISENDLAWVINTVDQKRQDQDNSIWSKLTSSVRWLSSLGVGDEAAKLFRNIWDGKSDPMVAAQSAAQQASINASPKSVNYEVGKRYKQGVYLGINPETGKKMFDQ